MFAQLKLKPALIPGDLLAVWSSLRLAVRSALHLTLESVCHPGVSLWLWLVVPQLLVIRTGDLGHNELDVLGHQLALLPGHWFTGISASPHLKTKLNMLFC